jgi:hypothetical protein
LSLVWAFPRKPLYFILSPKPQLNPNLIGHRFCEVGNLTHTHI